jgi:predicted ATPase
VAEQGDNEGSGSNARWSVVTALFCAAIERDQAARVSLLAGADLDVRREVESLLEAHAAAGPLDRVAAQLRESHSTVIVPTTGSGPATDSDADRSSARSSAPLAPGCRLGRYEIRSALGAGGMGEVYRAFDTRLGREVAIKVLRQRAHLRPGALRRFEQEARAASALNHPHIVTVHDIGEAGVPYIVMELIEGQSLRQRLGGPLPLDLLLTWAAQIADGLVAAHEQHIVHGDIKPENVVVSTQGIPKILDFGLAHFGSSDPPGDAAAHPLHAPLPDPGARGSALVGTPGYLAPELLAGETADQRSDQFSFGAMLYEMATGSSAFAGTTTIEVFARTLYDDPPPLAEARPDLPPRFARAIDRCLSKHRPERYPSTRALLDELRAVRAERPRRTDAGERRPWALPARRTRLIGRQRELAAIEGFVHDPQLRLLTLTGPGGTGKTRLGIEAAELLAPDFAGGVFFVALAAISDAALVIPAIAQAIGAVVSAGQPPLTAVIDCVQTRGAGGRVLLLLDNFEQIIDAGGAVGDLLAACPELTVLATSREVLRLYGEQVFPVTTLDRPDLTRRWSPEQLAACPAVALFVERAQAANPSFTLTAENADAVAALCVGLDGLPLALELAAAQARTQSPHAMQARLQHRLALLTGGARDLPPRQQTLRRALDWSHQLLDPTEQAVFRRLGVFAGGFTGEAAQAIADPYDKLGVPTIQVIAALVDKSLLQPAQPLAGGEARFLMLETLREYAREKLEASAESERTSAAHAGYFLILGEEGSIALSSAPHRPDDRGRSEPHWLSRFETEHDNFRAALTWLTRQRRAAWGLRLGLALFRFWERGEHLAEGRRRLGELVELPESHALPAARAQALLAAGVMASDHGDLTAGIDLHTRALQIYRQLDDRWGIVAALVALANQRVANGDNQQARQLLEESLPIWEQLGDRIGFARSLSNLAYVERAEGQAAEARRLYQRAAAIFEQMGDPISRAWILNHEGDAAREQGDLAVAEALHAAALSAFRSLDHAWGIASVLGDLGSIARQRADASTARRHYHEALATFVRLDHRRGIARLLECLALLEGEADPERGLRLAASAASLRDRVGGGPTGETRAELAHGVAAMRSRLGPTTARMISQQGAALSTAEALALALPTPVQ